VWNAAVIYLWSPGFSLHNPGPMPHAGADPNPNPSHPDHCSAQGPYLAGFSPSDAPEQESYGLQRLDHAVGNVHKLIDSLNYVGGFTGFHEFAEFTAEDVGTLDSGGYPWLAQDCQVPRLFCGLGDGCEWVSPQIRST